MSTVVRINASPGAASTMAAMSAAPINLINVEGAVITYGEKSILDHVSLGVNVGDRVGVVGRNGGGKSTLLGVLGGTREIEAGRVTRAHDATLGFVGQAPPPMPGVTIRRRVVGEVADHVWASDSRIRDILTGLLGGFDEVLLDRDLSSLSGGERQRVELARVLVDSPDIIILDEPTNHLDVEGVAWLATHLISLKDRAYVVVTHDRWFLDEVSTNTWEVVHGKVESYEGGYSAFVLAKAERARQSQAEEARRANLLRKELAWLRRGPPARTTKPKFRVAAANELISREPPPRDDIELMKFAGSRLGKRVFELTDVTLRVGDRTLVSDLTWNIGPGDRVGILGPNGAGKSTLLHAILGQRKLDGGRIRTGTTVKPVILSQRLDDIPDDDRVLESVERVARYVDLGKAGEISASSLCERLGFTGGAQWTRIADLSGGERRRLQLTRVLMSGPNVLMLDEPTNDFDVETLAALEDLLDGFAGTLLVVSHDRYFLERVCTTYRAVLGDGQVRDLPGGIDEYLELRASMTPLEVPAHQVNTEQPRMTGGQRHEITKQIASIERRIAKWQVQADTLHMSLAEHATDAQRLLADTAALREVEAAIAELEEQWLTLAEQLEES
jgi:ATP-binding cassette subfamily F protein uup